MSHSIIAFILGVALGFIFGAGVMCVIVNGQGGPKF